MPSVPKWFPWWAWTTLAVLGLIPIFTATAGLTPVADCGQDTPRCAKRRRTPGGMLASVARLVISIADFGFGPYSSFATHMPRLLSARRSRRCALVLRLNHSCALT